MLKRLCILVFSFVNFFAGGYIFLEFVVCIFVFCFPRFVVFSYFGAQVSCRRCAVPCLSLFCFTAQLANHRVGKLACFDKYMLFCVAAARTMRPH